MAVDLPGHGGSSRVRADLSETAELVADACGPADYVGYSLGGRVLLHLALSRPDDREASGAHRRDRRDRRRQGAGRPVRADELLARQLDEAGDDETALARLLAPLARGPTVRST